MKNILDSDKKRPLNKVGLWQMHDLYKALHGFNTLDEACIYYKKLPKQNPLFQKHIVSSRS